jgi:hypothetical protein
MTERDSRASVRRNTGLIVCAAVLAVTGMTTPKMAGAQAGVSAIPDLTGVWNGGGRARRINGPNAPWVPGENFPVLNERGLAFQSIFDEAIAPKYDCVPASSPAIQYDPYFMEVVQWPDRVLLRYEKDDQMRTVWLDGRVAPANEYTVQGFSVGRYEGDTLVVETDHFVFDITGFDDYNGIPSSQLKKVTELYWMGGDEGNDLQVTLTLADPMFLREPASYTTRWLPAPEGYQLAPYGCDAVEARRSVRFMVPRYN